MKSIKLSLMLFILGIVSFSCIPATYEKAEIKPGTFLSIGGGIHSYSFSAYDAGFYAIGPHIDASIYRGWNKCLEGSARISLGLGLDDYDYRPIPYLDGGLGIKLAPPLKYVQPAIRIDGCFFNMDAGLSSTLLLGIRLMDQKEVITLGLRPYIIPPGYYRNGLPYTDGFVIIHFPKDMSLFLGTNIQILISEIEHKKLYPWNSIYPIASIGFGWRFKIKEKKVVETD